jgi:hypothetical protein
MKKILYKDLNQLTYYMIERKAKELFPDYKIVSICQSDEPHSVDVRLEKELDIINITLTTA